MYRVTSNTTDVFTEKEEKYLCGYPSLPGAVINYIFAHYTAKYFILLIFTQIKKLGEEIRVEGMQDHLHIEWSTNTINVVISLLSTIARARLPAGRRLSDAAFR